MEQGKICNFDPPKIDIVEGNIYYKSVGLYFSGLYQAFPSIIPLRGIMYDKSGKIFREGLFQMSGLLRGREYHPNGKLRFIGYCCDKRGISDVILPYITGDTPPEAIEKESDHRILIPAYPTFGMFFDEEGRLLYYGKFEIQKNEKTGWPRVTKPSCYFYYTTDISEKLIEKSESI